MTARAPTTASSDGLRGNPLYSFINQIESIGTSNYNSLQATLRVSNMHGFSGQAAYTWSHSNDEVTAYRGALPQDSTNFKGDYGTERFRRAQHLHRTCHLRCSRFARDAGPDQGMAGEQPHDLPRWRAILGL